jgi:hypothetical protein
MKNKHHITFESWRVGKGKFRSLLVWENKLRPVLSSAQNTNSWTIMPRIRKSECYSLDASVITLLP